MKNLISLFVGIFCLSAGILILLIGGNPYIVVGEFLLAFLNIGIFIVGNYNSEPRIRYYKDTPKEDGFNETFRPSDDFTLPKV